MKPVMSVYLRVVVIVALLLAHSLAWSAPNKAPTVSLVAPASGSTFAAPANITISANASDSDGTISRVDFYQGATLIGTRTAAPYSMVWGNVAGGSYSLTAQAFDSNGASKASSAVLITVTGPKLILLSPGSGAMVYGGSTVVSGTFYGDSNTTVLVDNGSSSRLATLTANAYSTTIPLYTGPNTLRVTAVRRDKTFDSVTTTVIGNGNPLVVFTAPSVTTFDAPASINLVVDAVSPSAAISKVDFYRNGALLGTSSSPPYQYAWTNVGAGSYTIQAVATDTNGSGGSLSLFITVNGTNAPPTVALTSPISGAAFTAPANIAMTATAGDSDGTINRVEFLQNGSVVGTTNVAPYNVIWSNVGAGAYTLTARATDDRSAVTTSLPVNVNVSALNQPPSVSLTSPATGSTYLAPATISLAAAATDSDGTISKVDFYRGTSLIGTATNPPYTATWLNVPAGSYPLTAKATDDRGAVTTSTPVDVTVVTNSPPTVTLTAPVSGSSFVTPANINLTATASDVDGTVVRVEFYQGTTLLGTANAIPYSFAWSNAATGTYTLSAKAYDNGGAVTTSAPVTIAISSSALIITSPPGGSTVTSSTLTVSGTVTASTNSAVTVNGGVAALDGNGHFYASVSMVPGINTISAVLSAQDGQTTSQSITVTYQEDVDAADITASPLQGFVPLTVDFTVTPAHGATLQRVELDYGDDGNIDATLTSPAFTVTYSTPGIHRIALRAIDSLGRATLKSFVIAVTSVNSVDSTLRSIYNGMIAKLKTGDIQAALTAVTGTAHDRYQAVFNALASALPSIADLTGQLQQGVIGPGVAEYFVLQNSGNGPQLIPVYFLLGEDGVWRIESM